MATVSFSSWIRLLAAWTLLLTWVAAEVSAPNVWGMDVERCLDADPAEDASDEKDAPWDDDVTHTFQDDVTSCMSRTDLWRVDLTADTATGLTEPMIDPPEGPTPLVVLA